MNPNENRVAFFTNISDEAFAHPFGGVTYSFEPHEGKYLPYPLAEHLAKHLAYSMRLKGDTSARKFNPNDPTGGHGAVLWNDDEIKQDMTKILSQIYDEQKAKPKTEMELMQEQIDRLNEQIIGRPVVAPVAVIESPEASLPAVEPAIAEPAVPLVTLGDAPTEPSLPSAATYKDKAEVIAELKKREIKFDARAKKSELEELLS